MGHAKRDMCIAKMLKKISKDKLKLKFVSYATGYKCLVKYRYHPIDLSLPEMGKKRMAQKRIKFLIDKEKPDLIVSDEELIVLPLAKERKIPSILITNWLPQIEKMSKREYSFYTNLFLLSEMIIFPDREDSFEVPNELKKLVKFVNPIIFPSHFSLKDRKSIRKELKIDNNEKFILATAGGTHPIDRIFFKCILKAFQKLNLKGKLYLLSGVFKKEFLKYQLQNEKIIVKDFVNQIEKIMIASDLVITRGGHTTLWELASLGIPSISIPRPLKHNPYNEKYALNMEKLNTTRTILQNNLNIEILTDEINSILTSKKAWNQMSKAGLKASKNKGNIIAAKLIAELTHFGKF